MIAIRALLPSSVCTRRDNFTINNQIPAKDAPKTKNTVHIIINASSVKEINISENHLNVKIALKAYFMIEYIKIVVHVQV